MLIFKRIFSGILTVFLVTIVIFVMFQVIPGDPVLKQLGAEEIDNNPRLAQQLREEFNLEDPLVERYTNWVSGVIKGDLGKSFKYRDTSVNQLISERLGQTAFLTVITLCFIIIIAIPLGLFIATKKDKPSGLLFNIISQLGLAMPSFWVAILSIYFFTIKLKIFPMRTIIDFNHLDKTLPSIILPVLTLSFGAISAIIRYLTSAVANEERRTYTIVAKAKGLTDKQVLHKHVFKHALIQVITVISMIFIGLLTGSVLIENVFNIQGIGSLLIVSIKDFDYPVIQGIILYYAIVVVVVNLILDLLYMVIDPRISLS